MGEYGSTHTRRLLALTLCNACLSPAPNRLVIPRRPAWDASTTPDQLEEQERASFFEWRRELASLEQDERLVLTPFEKNLEVSLLRQCMSLLRCGAVERGCLSTHKPGGTAR